MDSLNLPTAIGTLGAAERMRLLILVAVAVAVPYFMTQRFQFVTPHTMPETALDRAIPFMPSASYLYLSLYVLAALPLAFHLRWEDLKPALFGFAWLVAFSHVFFVFWPTRVPFSRTEFPSLDPGMLLIRRFDTDRNACPSLHAALSVYGALVLGRFVGRGARWAAWGWAAGILLSTLLTKQHVVLDVVSGLVMAGLCFATLFQQSVRDNPSSVAADATRKARGDLTRGAESLISQLARLDARKRFTEFAIFGCLGALGVSLTLAGRWLPTWGVLSQVAGIAVTAVALNAFVLLMHDGMHGTLAGNARANHVLSFVLGTTFLMSFSAYRLLHERHHVYLGDPRDPDDYANYSSSSRRVWALHYVRIAVGSLLYLGAIPALALRFASPAERRRILTEYLLMASLYALLLRWVPWPILAEAWLLPLWAVGIMTGIRGLAQHGITDSRDPYLASRTILPSRLVRFLLLNENYHLEHHLFPEIPSYNLPKLHRAIWHRLPRAVSGSGYLDFLGRFFRATPLLDESPIGLEFREPEG